MMLRLRTKKKILKNIVTFIVSFCLFSLEIQPLETEEETNIGAGSSKVNMPSSLSPSVQKGKEKDLQINLSGFIPENKRIALRPFKGRNVFGKDDRVPMTSTEYPWSTIGRVELVMNNGLVAGWCTGTLIWRNLILTNAHCVINPETKTLTRLYLRFRPNYINGSFADESYVELVWWGTNDPDSYPHADWAILKINQDLGYKYGYMGWKGIDFSNPLITSSWFDAVGYSRDFPRSRPGEIAGVHQGCSIKSQDLNNGYLTHDCDTMKGSSGGPLFAMWRNSAYIIGLNSACLTPYNECIKIPQFDPRLANIAVHVSSWHDKGSELRQLNP